MRQHVGDPDEPGAPVAFGKPPPPKPANWAFAGIVVSVNSSRRVAAWHTTLSAPVMAKLLVRRAA